MRDFEWPIGDKRMRTKRLSSVRSTATPASTLPTVRDISILVWGGIGSCGIDVSRSRELSFSQAKRRFTQLVLRRKIMVSSNSASYYSQGSYQLPSARH